MSEEFVRLKMLVGAEAMERLAAAHVAVFGIGGVGSYAAEALARAGVGELTFVDHDTVGISNINRQAIALHSTVGQPKAECMARRALDINPSLRVHALISRYSADTRADFPLASYDYIIDAIDLVACKIDLILSANALGVPIISALGTGNKLDSSLFSVTDISKTENCPLARVMRKELRRRGVIHHNVVYSPESARTPVPLDGELPPPGRRSIPGSVSWVPGSAGMMLAGAVVRALISEI